jgi:hypothetical protein
VGRLLALSSFGIAIFKTHAWPGGPLTFGGIAIASVWFSRGAKVKFGMEPASRTQAAATSHYCVSDTWAWEEHGFSRAAKAPQAQGSPADLRQNVDHLSDQLYYLASGGKLLSSEFL